MSQTPYDPAADGWTQSVDGGFIAHVGPFWERTRDGGTEYGFIAAPHHANLVNVVQGGMIMTFADRVFGLEAWKATGQVPCVTVQFATQFIASTEIGAFVTTRPEIVRATRSVIFLEGKLLAQGTVVASCNGVWKIARHRKRIEEPGPLSD